jgi:hypothetical protein
MFRTQTGISSSRVIQQTPSRSRSAPKRDRHEPRLLGAEKRGTGHACR